MGAYYGLPIDMSSKTGGLKAIANALNEGDVARAQIATVLLGIPDPPQLFKTDRSRDRMITLIRDLHWSGMLKWDPDKHPRWPAGSADSKGGEFAPKGEGGETAASPASQSDTIDQTRSYIPDSDAAGRSARIQLADAGVSDAADDPVAQATARSAAAARQGRDAPNTDLAAAEEEDKEPRFGMGHNGLPEELIPQRLQRSPAGPAVVFLDNLLDITGPGDEANLEGATLLQRALLQQIHEVNPNYVYQSIEPKGGLAEMSWQGRLNVINRLQADLAAAIYRARGDIRPLQEVTLEFMQRTTNAAYHEAVQRYDAGDIKVRLSRNQAIGNKVDGIVRDKLRDFFNRLGISTEPGSAIRVNNRAYDSSRAGPPYRLPDARVGNFAFDVSLEAKKPSKDQIRDFFNADFKPIGVVIVRPNQLGNNSSYVIWRAKGD
jgi:hypothetical protein